MNLLWLTITANLQEHWEAYLATATALSVAAVCCMPPTFPRSLDEWWTWMRDSLQTAVPAARHSNHPTQPGPGPAQPKQ